MTTRRDVLVGATVLAVLAPAAGADWQPKQGPLMTRWAADVSPAGVHPEYPRPQMVREQWLNLNGLWECAVRPQNEGPPQAFDGRILVPFPIESALSGVMQRVDETQRVWYRRTFTLPDDWPGRRTLLHFGAVDWEASVWINGTRVGTHRGGYDPFTLDISDALGDGPQTIVVGVWDPTDAGTQPRGKQVRKPGGIFYTPTTGIWQTVWLEPVPAEWIRALRITPDVDGSRVRVRAEVAAEGEPSARVQVRVFEAGDGPAGAGGERPLGTAQGKPGQDIIVPLAQPKLWAPDSPYLYRLEVGLMTGAPGRSPVRGDRVRGYFGMRKIAVGADERGTTRLLLNNRPLFQLGLLDQGFWPDGLYTAPTDEALAHDLRVARQLGFNMIRKHVKVEPDRWYYWCDRLGLLVWQDMPSGDRSPAPGRREIERSAESAVQFELELKRMIDNRGNHPCIVAWVPFNEAWGQYDTSRIAQWLAACDPSRLVDSASGWHDVGAGQVHDVHSYPGPACPQPEPSRAAVLGEFGGLGLPVKGHTWQAEKHWGYRSFTDADSLTAAYVDLLGGLRLLLGEPGLSAAVYTQTTDVETEVNGVLTYDRLPKMDPERVAAANRRMYLPPPVIRTLVPTSQQQGIAWRYTTDKPADNWHDPGFDDSAWKLAPAPFARQGTPGVVARTPWETSDIWLRRTVQLAEVPANPRLRLYHDEDCEVYVNGRQVAAARGYTTSYVFVALSDASALHAGRNVMAVHCHQTTGGQGIDLGLVEVLDRP